jgi:hypothetical protein
VGGAAPPHRSLLLAHTYLQRVTTGNLLGAPALGVLAQVADGGEVDADVAESAYALVRGGATRG